MHYASRLLNRPLAITPGFLNALSAEYAQRRPGAYLDRQTVEHAPAETLGQIAIIPVQGLLTNVSNWWDFGMSTGYDEITANLHEAFDDDAVDAIILHVDSPGGLCAGCAEVGDLIYASRGRKPIIAAVDSWACSAAYWIASACDMVVLPQHAQAGHVGAVQLHFDITRALDEAGVTVTTIQFGATKTDGYPTTKMTEPAMARIQADVDLIGEAFVAAVARNRGMAIDKVRDTQARSFLGADAVAVGFADALMSPTEAYQSLVTQLQDA